jgi:glycosyltransferase involved in cell wall biosynthesis
VFVFPSLYEGFGMPVLEAMACGAPTITSSTSSLPEVAGDAALLVNPEDAEALGAAMVKVLSEQALQQQLRDRGFERTRLFTWQRAALRTSALYRELCA